MSTEEVRLRISLADPEVLVELVPVVVAEYHAMLTQLAVDDDQVSEFLKSIDLQSLVDRLRSEAAERFGVLRESSTEGREG